MTGNKAPCKNCKDRKIINNVSCHSTCEKYKQWAKKLHADKQQQEQRKKMDIDSYSMFESMAIRKPNKGGKIWH